MGVAAAEVVRMNEQKKNNKRGEGRLTVALFIALPVAVVVVVVGVGVGVVVAVVVVVASWWAWLCHGGG